MRRLALLMTISALLGGLLGPTPASAEGPEAPFLELVDFTVPASNGFKFSFTASSGHGQRDQVQASFHRGGRGVTYSVNGGLNLRKHRIDADLGPFGSIHGRFTGNAAGGGKGCDPTIKRNTKFRGRVEVRGEHGLSTAKARRASGKLIALVADPGCALPEPERSSPTHPEQVHLATCPANGPVRYFAHLDRRQDRATHQVNTFDQRGEVGISRYALITTTPDSFDVSDDLATATLAPGGPFDGSATFAEGRLTGDLTVELLGMTEPLEITPAKAAIERGGGGNPSCSGR